MDSQASCEDCKRISQSMQQDHPHSRLGIQTCEFAEFNLFTHISWVFQEKEHLHKFNLTWPLHNKHLFHSLIYMEPGLHDNLGTLIKQLRAVASQKEPYHEESYSNLLQRLVPVQS